MNKLISVTAPHFSAAVIVNESGIVIEAAPILGWTLGKTEGEVLNYWSRKGYSTYSMPDPNSPAPA